MPKSGDPNIPSNNRPISSLSTLSKILEKVVYTQFSTYLHENQRLSPDQYAYRPHHSTEEEDAVLDAVERLVTNIDNGLISSATTLYLPKAFDSINHDLLINKLSWYGITNTTWFRSNLTDQFFSFSLQMIFVSSPCVELSAWFSVNSLKKNEAKTNIMLAGTKKEREKGLEFHVR